MEAQEEQIKAVEKQIEAVEEQIEVVEEQIEAVEEQIQQAGQKFSSAIQDGNQYLADVWRKEKKQLREETKQLREKEKQLRKKGFAAAKPVPDPGQVLSRLFRDELLEARRAMGMPERRRETAKLPEFIAEFGDYFSLKGRDETLKALVLGAARVFSTFNNQTSTLDSLQRHNFLLLIVSYPGAGKTTAGSCLSALLRDYWLEHVDEEGFRTELQAELGTPANFVEFKQRIANVLDAKFEARMYHSVEAAGNGDRLPAEEGLGCDQILALRCLHAAITPTSHTVARPARSRDTSYQQMLERLDKDGAGLKTTLVLDDVISFIRSCLNIPDDKKIFLSWFFDEVNKASKVNHGEQATWMQQVLASYVNWMMRRRGSNTFPLVTIATTRFSSTSLVGTPSGKALKVFIPVRPLTMEEVSEVVTIFLNRLYATVGVDKVVREVDGSWKPILRLAGGNPRILSFLLRGACSATGDEIDVRNVLHALEAPVTRKTVQSTLQTAWELITPQYYGTYKSAEKVNLVLRALHQSLLGIPVMRDDLVWPDSKYADRWMDMEAEGLIALVLPEISPAKRRRVAFRAVGSVGTFDSKEYRVSFSPMMAYHMVRSHDLRQMWPNLTQPSSACDIEVIRFMVKAKALIYGNGCMLKLRDMIPGSGISIPESLARLELYLPNAGDVSWDIHQIKEQIKDREGFMEVISTKPGDVFFTYTHNHMTDSIMRLMVKDWRGQKHDFYVFVESKSRYSVGQTSVSYDAIIKKLEKNVRGWGIPRERMACIYWSDEKTDRAKQSFGLGEFDKRIVIGGKYPEETFELLAAVRHILELE